MKPDTKKLFRQYSIWLLFALILLSIGYVVERLTTVEKNQQAMQKAEATHSKQWRKIATLKEDVAEMKGKQSIIISDVSLLKSAHIRH
ncbi:unnamed protein product [marine sediment metagenome]|uniref:Uncharacterized protein n=1 Tax=marine sediment metagenome TaxID=412755 RepID=X0RM88_9ZZZZ